MRCGREVAVGRVEERDIERDHGGGCCHSPKTMFISQIHSHLLQQSNHKQIHPVVTNSSLTKLVLDASHNHRICLTHLQHRFRSQRPQARFHNPKRPHAHDANTTTPGEPILSPCLVQEVD
jgi:hypothetical protein